MSKQKETILIDIDQTFVDSGTPWLAWMEYQYGISPDLEMMDRDLRTTGFLNYNLGKYFHHRPAGAVAPYEFWEEPELYDSLKPLPGAVEAIYRLYEAGHPIGLPSYCKKGHFASKVRMIMRELDFLDLDGKNNGCGFYATKYKAGIKGSVIVDDRNEFLNQFSDDVLKIKFATPYTQDEPPRVAYDLETNEWSKIADFILETL